ncbi:hypothetical protein JCM17823_13310 [Halorubrum gandharaense]
MALHIRQVVSDGISLAVSRNGAILAFLFLAAETAGLLLFFGAGTLYIPIDIGTGLAPGSDIEAGGELPNIASSIAVMLTSLFMSVITIPLSIIAIRTFVGGRTESIPDAYIFDRIGRATLSGLIANLLYGFMLFLVPFAAGIVLLLSIGAIGEIGGIPDQYAGIVFVLVALVGVLATIGLLIVIWLHFLFLLHEISVRHRGVIGAFKGSWAAVRGNRIKLGLFGTVLVTMRFSAGWFGVPPADGQWTLFQFITTPISLVISAIVGVVVTAIFARAYRSLRPDVTDDFL